MLVPHHLLFHIHSVVYRWSQVIKAFSLTYVSVSSVKKFTLVSTPCRKVWSSLYRSVELWTCLESSGQVFTELDSSLQVWTGLKKSSGWVFKGLEKGSLKVWTILNIEDQHLRSICPQLYRQAKVCCRDQCCQWPKVVKSSCSCCLLEYRRTAPFVYSPSHAYKDSGFTWRCGVNQSVRSLQPVLLDPVLSCYITAIIAHYY